MLSSRDYEDLGLRFILSRMRNVYIHYINFISNPGRVVGMVLLMSSVEC